jgi:biopolymer transport protein TolR
MAMSTGTRAQINVTPMIDVLLVLIIIFMVITPLAPKGLNALVPQGTANPPAAEPSNDVVVTVHTDGSVTINQESVALANLHDRLAAIFRAHYNHVLFVRGEKNLEFQRVAEVIDIARGIGLERVALAME